MNNQDVWNNTEKDVDANLIRLAKRSGISDKQCRACLKDEGLETKILKMRLDADKEHEIYYTPAFIVNGKLEDADVDDKYIEKKLKALGH